MNGNHKQRAASDDHMGQNYSFYSIPIGIAENDSISGFSVVMYFIYTYILNPGADALAECTAFCRWFFIPSWLFPGCLIYFLLMIGGINKGLLTLKVSLETPTIL